MSLFHAGLQPAIDSNGDPISGATWIFNLTGTLTPVAVYSDSALSVSLGAVVTADSVGRFADIYLNDSVIYRAILKDAGGATLADIDPISATVDSALVSFTQAGANAVTRTVQAKLREGRYSTADYSSLPTPTTPDGWYWDYTNPDGAGGQQLKANVPASVNMTGGGSVQGSGLIFNGETSAATPNAGFAETNQIRMAYTVKAAAGQKLQVHMINGVLICENNIGTSGNEGAVIIGTMRAAGPASGGANMAMGVWGGDFHAEKTAGVATGKMVGLEVGVHSAVAQTYGTTDDRQNGIEVWSGDRSGITAVQAHDALKIFGERGWTTLIRALHTDNTTEVFRVGSGGNVTMRAPVTDITALVTTNQNSTTATFQVTGRNSGGSSVSCVIQAQAGGQINFGATTAHPVVFTYNNTEVVRMQATNSIFRTAAAVEATGAGAAALGANSPAATLTAPYTWLRLVSSDGSAVFIPAWK